MKRAVLAIGCNAYASMDELFGAEADASNVYSVLTDPGLGNYDEACSVLLLSATRQEIEQHLETVLFSSGAPDVFTLFFAGHGGRKDGNYYLCPVDADPSRMSTTAIGLPNLFTILNEAKPAQTNIIMDACESGGMVLDIGNLTKPELLGAHGTPSITFFVTSAADQYAREENGEGLGTRNILTFLRGDTVLNTNRPYLDLVEVGRAASEIMASSGYDQVPSVWGLNLHGASRFCLNPHFSGDKDTTAFLNVSTNQSRVAGHTDDLWREFIDLKKRVSPHRLWHLLTNATSDPDTDPNDVASFVVGVSTGLADRASLGTDAMARSQVLATCLAAIHRRTSSGGAIADASEMLISSIHSHTNQAFKDIAKELAADPYALLRGTGGLSELYYLPLRVSRLLGWAAAHALSGNLSPHDVETESARNLIRLVFKHYGESILSISDTQAPYSLAFILAAKEFGLRELGEEFIGRMFSTFISDHGAVADSGLKNEDVFEFMMAKAIKNSSTLSRHMARPSSLLPVILFGAAKFDLSAEVDIGLEEVDHLSMNVFIPSSYVEFAEPVISDGLNITSTIGHGVWCVEDFMRDWTERCLPQIRASEGFDDSTVATAAMYSSLLFPNREPWLLSGQFDLSSHLSPVSA